MATEIKIVIFLCIMFLNLWASQKSLEQKRYFTSMLNSFCAGAQFCAVLYNLCDLLNE